MWPFLLHFYVTFGHFDLQNEVFSALQLLINLLLAKFHIAFPFKYYLYVFNLFYLKLEIL